MLSSVQLLHFDIQGHSTPPRLLLKVFPAVLERAVRSPSPESSGSSLSILATSFSTASSPASLRLSLGDSLAGDDICSSVRPDPPAVGPPSALYLATRLDSGQIARVFAGALIVGGDTLSPAIFKSYGAPDFAELLRELDAYQRLAHLAIVAPTLYGVFGPVHEGWAGLLLEDAGTRLGFGDSWDDLGLARRDK